MLLKYDSSKNTSFKDHSTLIESWIKYSMLKYLDLFKVKTPLEMTLLFSLLDVDTHSVCAGKMESVGGWRCLDCIKNENTIFCQNCWSKMKDSHEGHNIVFITKVSGTCDCGDPNSIDKKFFCPNHKGPMTTEQEIQDYIQKSLGAEVVVGLKKINKEMFDEMGKYVIRAIQEKKTYLKDFTTNISSFIEFISTPCIISKACMHIIAELLLVNYPFKTKHVCLQLKEGKEKLVKSSVFNHDCTCPFIKLIMPFWPLGKEKVIYSFLHNYKLRKTMGLCYFLLYGDFIKNCLPDFTDLSVQIIFDEVCKEACNIEGLIENIYDSMPEIFTIFLKTDNYLNNPENIALFIALDMFYITFKEEKKFVLFKEVIFRLKCDTTYIMKPMAMKYLGNNLNIIFKLIDLMILLQNYNSVKVIFPHPPFKKNKYIIDLLDAELWLLDIFSGFISIFNFEDSKNVKEIFQYFSKKINNNKNILPKDEYSFHIPLFRGFSIFLNRYCFYYANKNNSDILQGLQSAIKLMSNHKECFKIMIESIYKVFGFITACGEEFLNYYGESMIEFEYIYYYNKQFIYRDFCLMKYALALKENADYFSFNVILSLCQVENSNKPLDEYVFKGKKIVSPDKWINDEYKKCLKFCCKILRIILSILRNNTCLIWNLGSSYSMLKTNKIEDTLIKGIINKDKDNFLELTKELIVNQTFIKENLAFYTDIYDYVFLCLRDILGAQKISELILSMTNKTLTQEKKAKFSIKDEFLNYLDLNYIIYPRYKSTVEKYISDFKSKIVSIFNTHFYPVNKFENKLTIEDYKQVYFNEGNFDFLFRFTALILQREGYFVLNEFFLPVLLNYLATFFCLENDQFIFFREVINNKIMQLTDVLEKNNLTDEVQISYCHFIVEKIAEHEKIYTISFTKKKEEPLSSPNDNQNIINEVNKINEPKKEIKVEPVKKSNKISMKDRMKNKFKKKNENISNKFGIEKIKLEKKKNNEACIYCLKPIDSDDLKKPFGKIGDFINDHFLSNAFFQVIRKEYKKHYEADLKLKSFDSIYYQPLERKNLRIISCNHYIHFSCHFEAFMKSNLKNSLNIFQCPLCHRLSETYIPMLDGYTEEQTFGIFKGYNLTNVYNMGKKNTDVFEKKEKQLFENSLKLLGFLDEKEENKKDDEKENEEEDIFNLKEFIPDIVKDRKEKENIDNQIITNNELDINTFKKDYPDFINSCKHFVEGFFGMKLNINSVDIESPFFKSLISNFCIISSIQYREFMDFYENIDDRKTTVNLWKNLILSLRMLLKLKIIEPEFFFYKFYSVLQEFKTLKFDRELDDLIKNDSLRLKLSQILFLSSLLFDYEEIEGYEKYIIYIFLPILGFGFFFKDIYFKNSFLFDQNNFLDLLKEDTLNQYLKNDKSINIILIHVLKKLLITKLMMKNEVDFDKVSLEKDDMLDLLDLSELKNKSFLEILDYLDEYVMNDSPKEKNKNIPEIYRPNNNYRESLKIFLNNHITVAINKKCDTILSPLLFGSCLPIIYSFIELPETAIEFEYEFYNKPCEVCQKKGYLSLICLDCGKKVCDSRSCLKKIDGISMPGFIAHTLICGGGRSAFLQSEDCSVLFVSNKAVFKKFIPFYVNKFGEGIVKSSFGSEFKLCKDEIQNALKMFTKYSYSNAPIIT